MNVSDAAATDRCDVSEGGTMAASRLVERRDLPGPVPAVPRRSFPSWHSFVVAGGLVASVAMFAAARAWELGRLPFPSCWLRRLTGIPCPTCGCTRSLQAWAELDPVLAFQFNPLFFLVCAAVLFWPVLTVGESISGRAWFSRAWAGLSKGRAWKVAAVLLALNWLYLCRWLPK